MKEKYKTYLYYALFPHKIITWKQIYNNKKKVKNTLQPQLIDGNTALQYINNVLPSKSNIYPVSKEDCDKVHQLCYNSKYNPHTFYDSIGKCKKVYFLLGIIELLLSATILFNIVNNYLGNNLIIVLYGLITVLLVSHGITLLTRTFVRNEHFEARIAGSNCYKIKLRTIVDTKKVLKPNNKEEYTDDEKLLELLPEIIIENKYDHYEYLINGNNSVNNLNYQDLVTHFSKKYDTNNNVYSILDKFSQQDTTVWELPGLNCYLNNTVFKNFVKLDDTARQEYEKLYFKIIDKLEYYVKTYPQYLDNEYGYNKLRILLTVSTIKELDKISYEKQLAVSYVDNVNHQIEKDKKKEIEYIFDNTVVNEIWNP